MKLISTFALLFLFGAPICIAQIPDARAEAAVSCPVLLQPEKLVPYGFAKATLVSLWYAKTAAEHASEIQRISQAGDSAFSFMTEVMRITKTSTNDFICAKRVISPFATSQSGENIGTAASLMAVVYDAHISINTRLLDVVRNIENTDQAKLADQLSTLQVERGQRWADLVEPSTLALLSLVDLKRTDANGKANILMITKAQKAWLLNWATGNFPEFGDGTPKDRWSDPAKTVQLYFQFLLPRKGTDE